MNKEFKVGEQFLAVNDGNNGLPNKIINGEKEITIVTIVDDSYLKQASGLLSNWDCVVKSDWGYRKVNSKTAKFKRINEEFTHLNWWW